MARKRRPYPREFKIEAIKLIAEGGLRSLVLRQRVLTYKGDSISMLLRGDTIYRPKHGAAVACLVWLALSVVPYPCSAAEECEKTLRVGVRGMDYKPSLLDRIFVRSTGNGVIHELMLMLKPLLKVRIVYVVSSTHVERRVLLKQGRIDVIAFDSPQFTSEPFIDFVSLGLHINRQLFVHKLRKDIFSVDDLVNVRLAVIKGDNYMPHLSNALGSTIVIMDSPNQALEALNNGRVDAYLAPSARTAENIINQERLHDVVKVGLRIEQIHMNLAVRKDNLELKQSLEEAILSLRRSGKLRTLHEKWYDVNYQPNPWRKVFKLGLVGAALVVFWLLLEVFVNLRLRSRFAKVSKDFLDSEERYRSLIHASPDMVIVLDREGLIQHANPVADQVLGSPGEPMVGSELGGSVQADQRAALAEFIELTTTKGRGRREFKFVDDKRVVHEVDVAARVLPTPDGEDLRICCFARDVTQRNNMERELVQADRMATIGKMAAGVAHEINNPIGIVQANVELLLARKLYLPESREFLEAIRRNSIRAGQITQDLLAMTRPKKLQMRQVNLEEIINLSLRMMSGQLKGIEIIQERPNSPAVLMADPNLLQQVLVNLFLNAGTAMKDCQVRRLLIRFCSGTVDDILCLRVEDSGPGIEKELLNEIFEPFFSRGKKEGFGLGLFISRLIIEKHHGMIFAESDVGKGAQFIIELPVRGPGTDYDDNGET